MAITINGTTGISGVDGSAGTPSLQGQDTNTGFFYGTDILGLSTGGSERMRIDSSGNVGIGVAPSPSYPARLNLYDTADCTIRITKGGVVAGSIKAVSSALAFGVDVVAGDTERMRIDSSGNLLVGTTTVQTGVTTDPVGISLYGSSANGAGIFTRSSPNPVLYINNKTANSGLIQFYNGGNSVGSITSNGTGTTYGTSSDYRLKENIQPMQNALARNAQLKPVTYTWKADGSSGEGFIAHELQDVCPSAVTGQKDAVDADGNPVYQGVDTSFLVGHLVACIQELKAEIDELKAKVNA